MMSWCTKSICGDTRVMSWDVFCMLLTHVNVLLSEPQLVSLLPDVNLGKKEDWKKFCLCVRRVYSNTDDCPQHGICSKRQTSAQQATWQLCGNGLCNLIFNRRLR
jgi:hypothetical protein